MVVRKQWKKSLEEIAFRARSIFAEFGENCAQITFLLLLQADTYEHDTSNFAADNVDNLILFSHSLSRHKHIQKFDAHRSEHESWGSGRKEAKMNELSTKMENFSAGYKFIITAQNSYYRHLACENEVWLKLYFLFWSLSLSCSCFVDAHKMNNFIQLWNQNFQYSWLYTHTHTRTLAHIQNNTLTYFVNILFDFVVAAAVDLNRVFDLKTLLLESCFLWVRPVHVCVSVFVYTNHETF